MAMMPIVLLLLHLSIRIDTGNVRITMARYTAETSKPLWTWEIPQSFSIEVNIEVTTILSM